MKKHILALDIVGESKEDLVSLKDACEFYLFMEEAQGDTYFHDLNSILERGHLNDMDRERVQMLAGFLADIHSKKYFGDDQKILYRRRIRELIGHGECIMGVIDAYDNTEFASDRDLIEYAEECLVWWGRLRNRSERLCMVHGDFHPGNIRFQGGDFTVLDRSRGSWGEPADDVSCLGINFLYYALKHGGAFGGPFMELFHIFLDYYLEKTGDKEMLEVMQPFFAFRTLVIANPRFYPGDPVDIKRKLFQFGRLTLDLHVFDLEKINKFVEG